MKSILTTLWIGLAWPASACDLALLLAVDVSGSVDRREFQIQMDGLADALRVGVIADGLVQQQAFLALMQWTGSSRQRITIPWQQVRNHAEVTAFADRVAADPRVWRNYSTAIGEALMAAQAAFEDVPQCARKVIDVSGDGVSNEGISPARRWPDGVTINALALETDSSDLTAYFFENVIAGEGAFVETANGFEDYPDKIHRKLQREVLFRVGALATD